MMPSKSSFPNTAFLYTLQKKNLSNKNKQDTFSEYVQKARSNTYLTHCSTTLTFFFDEKSPMLKNLVRDYII